MRGVAGIFEADGAGVGQSGDQVAGRLLAIELAAPAMDDQGRMLDPVEQSAHVLADQACPDGSDRIGIVAREFEAGPVGELAVLRRHRLGEDRLPGGQCEALEIVADGEAAGLAGLGREAQIPLVVVADAGGHVDDDRPGEAVPGRAGEDVPEDGRAERPADSDRALKVQGSGQLGDVRRHPLDAGCRGRVTGCPVPAQVDGDDPEVPGELFLTLEEAGMRHQPVQQHQRRAAAAVPIGEPGAVRSGENLQNPSQDRLRPCSGFCGNRPLSRFR